MSWYASIREGFELLQISTWEARLGVAIYVPQYNGAGEPGRVFPAVQPDWSCVYAALAVQAETAVQSRTNASRSLIVITLSFVQLRISTIETELGWNRGETNVRLSKAKLKLVC